MVLKTFLERLGFKPNKVMFMDDSIEQLKSVESAANALGIEFIGFHYIAAETISCEFNEKVGEFQFKNLVEHEEWMSDSDAKKVVNQQTCD